MYGEILLPQLLEATTQLVVIADDQKIMRFAGSLSFGRGAE